MKFYKFISVILHPIVVPTLGVLLYFILIPNRMGSNQKLAILGLVFVVTYLVPLFVLIILKVFELIKSYKLHSIKERKIPICLMIVLYYLLGNTLSRITMIRDLGTLFYATSFGLVIIYLLFIFKTKTSLHLFSLGISVGFFMLLSTRYLISFLPIILILILISGLLASARLYLKAHTPKEVYLGFLLGVISPFIIHSIL
ncbi:MAG: hypothetical protein ACPG44_09875 [Polaribacter sp.]